VNRIADYALIGDCHSAALVGARRRNRLGLLPPLRLPAVFVVFSMRSVAGVSRSCRPMSGNSPGIPRRHERLVTTSGAPAVSSSLPDCMPVSALDPAEPTEGPLYHSDSAPLRCRGGAVDISATVAPRFEYGSSCRASS